MSHPDRDRLALHALGEGVGVADHLQDCRECRTTVAAWREVAALTAEAAEMEAPPRRVWRGIRAAVRRGGAAPPRWTDGSSATQRPAWTRSAGRRVAAAAAGVVLIAGLATGVGVLRAPADPIVLAAARLEPLASGTAGTARLTEDAGGLALLVEVGDLPSVGDGYHAVWLLDGSASRLLSLGPLAAGSAVIALPDGLDLATFTTVDISLEPFDGDPTHSGHSLLRGALLAAGDQLPR